MFHEPMERTSEIATPKRSKRPKIFCCQNPQYSSQNGERNPPHKGMIKQKSPFQKNQHQVEIAGVMNYHLSTRQYVQGEKFSLNTTGYISIRLHCWIPHQLRPKVTVDAPLSKEVHLRLARLAVPSPYIFAVWIRPMDTGIPTPRKKPNWVPEFFSECCFPLAKAETELVQTNKSDKTET